MTPAGLTKRSIGSALPNTWQHGSINRGYEAFRLYANGDTVANLEARGIEVLVAVSRPENARTYDFRPPKPDAKPPPQIKAKWRKTMKDKLRTKDAKAKYNRRKCTVEPVFDIIKNVLGFTRFSPRGLEKVKTEWILVTLAHNCKRLCNLKMA